MSDVERLAERERQLGRPVRVGLVGAGQMGRGLAVQVGRIPGMDLVAVVDVDDQRAHAALKLAGRIEIETDPERAAEAILAGRSAALDDAAVTPELGLDVVVEATGVPEIGAAVAHACLLGGAHVVMLNVEADVTVGRYLDAVARSAGLVYSIANGDEPVCAKELVDFAHDLAFEVVCAGKGKNNPLDVTATPESVAQDAERKHMNPKMLASFVDGSKTMIEMAALANGTGLRPDVVGMHGPRAEVEELPRVFRPRSEGGILHGRGRVDYAFGPAPGVFVVIAADDPVVDEEMAYLSMGEGPYWCLYRPYHLASIEAPRSIARAVLDGEPGLRPTTWTAEVVAVAKRDLRLGDVLDGIGGETVHGVLYPADEAAGLLPLGLADGALVDQPVRRGAPVPHEAVELRPSVIASLRRLQDQLFT